MASHSHRICRWVSTNPAPQRKAPKTPNHVIISLLTQRGARRAIHTSAFRSASFNIEVCILTDCTRSIIHAYFYISESSQGLSACKIKHLFTNPQRFCITVLLHFRNLQPDDRRGRCYTETESTKGVVKPERMRHSAGYKLLAREPRFLTKPNGSPRKVTSTWPRGAETETASRRK